MTVANFYKDNDDILFHMRNLDFSRVIELTEDSFKEKDEYAYAPENFEDALDNYGRVLEIVGEIAGEFVAPRARGVDAEGATFKDGNVSYAKGTLEAIARLNKSDLLGFILPRKYGGINMPLIIYTIAVELIARADASLMNVFGLQAIGDIIRRFGSGEQKERILPRFASGEVMGSMALTEPDAGSDLQVVMLKAAEGDDGNWRLNGVKRFITNGCADISLVMARSEDGISGGRGLSLFIYERDENMKIRRIEHKLGIKGSPTCELQFNNAKAELLGKRKFGLVKYTMSLLNGARLSVAAQSIGIAEAAFRLANSYATDRVQFGKAIREFPAVCEMLVDMRITIEASRMLLYETARIVDIKEGIETRLRKYPEKTSELKEELKKYSKYASLLTPIVKGHTSEIANKVCYDALQIHGGVGFTCEFDIERLSRDVRITTIYEGTTQLQNIASIGGIISGVLFQRLNEYETKHDFSQLDNLYDVIKNMRSCLESTIACVKEKRDSEFQGFHADRIVNMATDIIMSYLLCINALKSDEKRKTAKLFISKAAVRVKSIREYIILSDGNTIGLHKEYSCICKEYR